MGADVSVKGGELRTPVGDAPVIPLFMIFLGGYLAWFGVHYWRDQAVVWPSDPIKDVLTGKGLPSPTPPASTIQQDIENAQIGAGATQESRAAAANAATFSAGASAGLANSAAALGIGGGVTGAEIAAEAARHVGHRYVFGGAPGRDGTGGWDCSSFDNWVVGAKLRLGIPSYGHGAYNGSVHGPSTLSWISWSGCKTVPHRDIKPGDMLVWETHMGIALSATEMISAEDPAQGTRKSTIKGMSASLRTETLVARRLRETLLAQAATTAKGGTPAKNKAIGKLLAARYGWSSGRQWNDLVKLWDRESGWNERATNPSSGAYGIPQSLPASKMASEGRNWKTSASTQIKWGLKYIKGRYGSPSKAWAHELQIGWY